IPSRPCRPPAAWMTGPGVVHGFVYQCDSTGHVASVPTALLHKDLAPPMASRCIRGSPGSHANSAKAARWATPSRVAAVAVLVSLAGAAGAGLVASDLAPAGGVGRIARRRALGGKR